MRESTLTHNACSVKTRQDISHGTTHRFTPRSFIYSIHSSTTSFPTVVTKLCPRPSRPRSKISRPGASAMCTNSSRVDTGLCANRDHDGGGEEKLRQGRNAATQALPLRMAGRNLREIEPADIFGNCWPSPVLASCLAASSKAQDLIYRGGNCLRRPNRPQIWEQKALKSICCCCLAFMHATTS